MSLAQDLYIGKENLLMVYERKILHVLDFNITFADVFSLFSHHLLSCIRYIDISNEMIVFLYHCGCYLVQNIFLHLSLSSNFSDRIRKKKKNEFLDRHHVDRRTFLSNTGKIDQSNHNRAGAWSHR